MVKLPGCLDLDINMPEKFIRCVKKVAKSNRNVNPYAICRKSTGYYGTTHEIGINHKLKNK